MCCRKNWTSSWTVLQGSTLLFAKGQGGGTSWVSDRNLLLRFVSCQQSRIVFRQKSLKLAVSVFEWFVGPLDGSWGWIFSLLRVSFSISLPSAPSLPSSLSSLSSPLSVLLPCSHTTTVAPSLNFSCHCWVTGSRLLRNVLLSPMAALSSTEPPLYVLPPSFCVLLSVLLCMPPPSCLPCSDPNPTVCF